MNSALRERVAGFVLHLAQGRGASAVGSVIAGGADVQGPIGPRSKLRYWIASYYNGLVMVFPSVWRRRLRGERFCGGEF